LEGTLVDQGTWDRLTGAQQDEFHRLAKIFIPAVQASPIHEGFDFHRLCHVEERDGAFFVAGAGPEVSAVSSQDRQVIETLFRDAVQNLNR
jgi:hypothetical protein